MADTTAILARFALLALALGLAGVPAYLRIAGQTRAGGRLRIALASGAVLAIAASLWWAASSIAAMAAMPLGDLDRATFDAVAAATPIGAVLMVRLAATATFLLAAILFPRTFLLTLLAGIAVASSAWTGHAGAAEGMIGNFQRLSDVLHMGGAALWFGALLVFLFSLGDRTETRALTARLEAFARTGTAIVIVLAVTGVANAALIGRSGWAPTSAWSLLLAVKLVLFAAMLGIAALNRWKLAPALKGQRPGAEGRLRVSLTMETACALAIFAIVAVLGLSDPSGV